MANGFNTEIVFEGTLFHIQTEARRETAIETAVYVKGAVIHLVKTSRPDLFNAPGTQEFTSLLEDQHRQVVAQIRAGEIKAPLPPESGCEPQEQ